MRFGGPYFGESARHESRENHLHFLRQQSLDMQLRDWEDRAQPITSWETLMLRGAAAAGAIFLIWWFFDFNWLLVALIALADVMGDK